MSLRVCITVCAVASLVACSGKDSQQLKPLSSLRRHPPASSHAEGPGGNPAETIAEPSPATSDGNPEGELSFATGTPGWRQESHGRNSGEGMTFGLGSSGDAPSRFAFTTDSTGADGTALGTGTSYGAAKGTSTTPRAAVSH